MANFDSDKSYIQGLEDMFLNIKAIYELTVSERSARFGELSVPHILDKYDFQQIRERMAQ